MATFYYSCCRDGDFHTNTSQCKTEQLKESSPEDTQKLNDLCISRIYVTKFSSHHIEVTYMSAHTGHELGISELRFLPLPESTKQAVSQKISLGNPTVRILDGNVCIMKILPLYDIP